MISCSWAFYLNPLEPPATEDVAGAGLGGQEIFPLSLSILVVSGDSPAVTSLNTSSTRTEIIFSFLEFVEHFYECDISLFVLVMPLLYLAHWFGVYGMCQGFSDSSPGAKRSLLPAFT